VTEKKKPPTGRIRVLLLSPSLSAVSGVSTHANMLLHSELTDEFDMRHFQTGSEGRQEGALGKVWRSLTSPFMLASVLIRWRADIVHLNTSMDLKAFWRDLGYLVIARFLGRQLVNQVHGGALPQTFFSRSKILTWVLRQALVGSSTVLVLSRQELEAYQAFDSRIRVTLVPNAIAAAGLTSMARRENLSAPLRLVYVGRLVATKGLTEIVEGLALLKKQGRRYIARVAGSGPGEALMREAAAKAGIADGVEFLGPIFGEEKNRLWLESDVFIFPTYHREGLPYSLLESLGAGCVPVTCSVAAISDVMQDGVHGLFVSPRDPHSLARAVARLDDDRCELARMADAGRNRVRELYTTDRLTRDVRAVYEELLGR
jgi:glycosyltransferase involved in cell wall biosynthesis